MNFAHYWFSAAFCTSVVQAAGPFYIGLSRYRAQKRGMSATYTYIYIISVCMLRCKEFRNRF